MRPYSVMPRFTPSFSPPLFPFSFSFSFSFYADLVIQISSMEFKRFQSKTSFPIVCVNNDTTCNLQSFRPLNKRRQDSLEMLEKVCNLPNSLRLFHQACISWRLPIPAWLTLPYVRSRHHAFPIPTTRDGLLASRNSMFLMALMCWFWEGEASTQHVLPNLKSTTDRHNVRTFHQVENPKH